MIKYKLICKDCNIKFDSWFASSNEYEIKGYKDCKLDIKYLKKALNRK